MHYIKSYENKIVGSKNNMPLYKQPKSRKNYSSWCQNLILFEKLSPKLNTAPIKIKYKNKISF